MTSGDADAFYHACPTWQEKKSLNCVYFWLDFLKIYLETNKNELLMNSSTVVLERCLLQRCCHLIALPEINKCFGKPIFKGPFLDFIPLWNIYFLKNSQQWESWKFSGVLLTSRICIFIFHLLFCLVILTFIFPCSLFVFSKDYFLPLAPCCAKSALAMQTE